MATSAAIAGCSSPRVHENSATVDAEEKPNPEKQEATGESRRLLRNYEYFDEHGNRVTIPVYENLRLRNFDAYTANGVDPGDDTHYERPKGKTEWQHFSDAKEMLRKMSEKPKKVIIMLSGKTCTPCHKALEWWRVRDIGSFEAYNFEPDDDSSDQNLGGLTDAYPEDLNRVVPIILVIDTTHLKQGEKFHRSQVVKVVGQGRASATYGLAEWLNENGY